ncbi:MAG: DUF456 domain-containing protein [Patescibacteria group bacterium]
MEILIIIITVLLIIAGFIGIFLPILPGTPLIFLGTLVYGFYNGFEKVGILLYVVFGVLTVISLVLDHLAAVYGTKKFGGTKWGIAGAFLGGILGLVFGLFGLIFGAILGAIVFELSAGQNLKKAIKAGGGVIFGFLGGIVLKTILALTMIGIFLWKIL